MNRIIFLAILATLLGSNPASAATTSEKACGSFLDMTFPEFEAVLAKTDTMLLPLGAIEEHGPNLPLGSDAFHSVGQLCEVAARLRSGGVETFVGPQLNIGLAYPATTSLRPGANMYPGNLTVSPDTFVALYVDVLRSFRENGVRRVFLYSGHFAAQQIDAMVQIAERATQSIDGMSVFALVESQQLPRLKSTQSDRMAIVDRGMDRDWLSELLGRTPEPVTATHADGWEISVMLHFRPDLVRPGYQKLPYSPSSAFIAVQQSGDRSKNPNGTGGFATTNASPKVGKQIVDYRTARIADAVLKALKN